jgi:sialate O-acetylesterase
MPTLHPLCTDHAVLSAHRPRIQGTTTPGTPVTVLLAGTQVLATADADGRWLAEFPALPSGGPHTLIARDASGETSATDILLGEVWLGSGQSNMEWNLAQTKDTEADIAAAHEPRLRVFTVVKASSLDGPRSELSGRWQVSTPREAGTMSAVAYFFGRKMAAETGLPFGLIVSAWGGSAIAPWLPETTLHTRPEYSPFLHERDQARAHPAPGEDYTQHSDPGIAPHAAQWASPTLDDSAWPLLNVPGQWQDEGWGFNGAVWYRRTVELPPAWIGQDLELYLGIVDDFDQTYANGTLIGAMGIETSNWWATPRAHVVPASVVTGPTLQLAVRAFDIWGGGGILGNVTLRPLHLPDAKPLPLSGRWRAKAELELPRRFPGGPAVAPTGLWNGMIAPLLGTSLSGVLWYQGESDVDRARLYPRLLTDLITTWRSAFAAPELPFGIVQLANFQTRRTTPAEDPWAALREAQRRVALHLPACGLALAIDAGEADDIHPRYKRTVGERLALWALHQVHRHSALPYSGPLPAEVWPEADGLRIRFTHAESLRVRGDALRGFQLRSPDGEWLWADQATVTRDTVFVRTAAIPAPVAVRYAWQANPETTLENAANLPASPFHLATLG